MKPVKIPTKVNPYTAARTVNNGGTLYTGVQTDSGNTEWLPLATADDLHQAYLNNEEVFRLDIREMEGEYHITNEISVEVGKEPERLKPDTGPYVAVLPIPLGLLRDILDRAEGEGAEYVSVHPDSDTTIFTIYGFRYNHFHNY